MKTVDVDETSFVSSIVGKSISHEEKLTLLNKQPCQTSKAVLLKREKKIGKRDRCCPEGLFCCKDVSKRSWLTSSLNNDALYRIPCLVFSDEVLRGKCQWKNQGNAFVKLGFSNWKKQFEYVQMYEESQSHFNSKVSQAILSQKKSMRGIFEAQQKVQEVARRRHVQANRKILKRVIDSVIFLGKQELAFCGYRESLVTDLFVNAGKFLETLKYLANYDDLIASHLVKIENNHREMEEKKAGSKKVDKIRRFGRGSKLTFMSRDIQNKLIDIISKEISLDIVNLMKGSVAWALIADTTPDVSKHEEISFYVQVISKSGKVREHLLFCTGALSMTVEQLLNHIANELQRLAVPYDNLVA